MELIHIADVHLDSSLEGNLTKQLARERRKEILSTFRRVISYARIRKIKGILIAGDFFDSEVISKETGDVVYKEIIENPQIDFFYLRGNHDSLGFFNKFEWIPQNLKLFQDRWTSYRYEKEDGRSIVVSGIELSSQNKERLYEELKLEEKDFNIVILHGDVSNYKKEDSLENIEIKKLYDKHIDYLALGHIHAPKIEKLPKRGEYCYPGCLEGRGFDEIGEHGFRLLSIDEESFQYKTEFVPFAKRRLFELKVDVSLLTQTTEMVEKIRFEARNKGITEEDLVKVILVGSTEKEEKKDVEGILLSLENDFYFTKIYDRVSFKINYENFRNEASLKGEFIRLLEKNEELSEGEKEEIMKFGLKVLRGEELSL